MAPSTQGCSKFFNCWCFMYLNLYKLVCSKIQFRKTTLWFSPQKFLCPYFGLGHGLANLAGSIINYFMSKPFSCRFIGVSSCCIEGCMLTLTVLNSPLSGCSLIEEIFNSSCHRSISICIVDGKHCECATFTTVILLLTPAQTMAPRNGYRPTSLMLTFQKISRTISNNPCSRTQPHHV